MSRTTTNALLDTLAAALFLAMLATGFVLQFVLPPGSGKLWTLWSLERHDWAHLHAVVSAVLLVVLIAHVALHWKWITEVVSRRLGGRRVSGKKLALVAIVAPALLAGGFAAATLSMREPRRDLSECKACGGAVVAPAQPALSPTFERDISQILAANCVGCHQASRARGGVRLDGYAQVIEHVEKGSPARSRLLRALDPPLDTRHTVDAATLRLLERWITEGAKQ